MENGSVNEYKSKAQEYEMNEAKKGMIVHAAVTVVVCSILAVVNLTFVPEFMWFIFPVVGMSIGLLVHYVFGYRLLPKFMADRERRIEEWR